VLATMRGGWISEGKRVREFEVAFGERFGVPHALALNSGTAALHLALVCAGVGPGDEVVTTAQTFVATAMSVLHVGARPVFADIFDDRPVLDPTDVARRVTDRTKAILVVHYGGEPSDMDEIGAIARRHNLTVIEDAAHALGATYKGRPVGTLGDYAIFSFQAIKQLTTADGGMLVAMAESAHREAYRRRWFGIDRERRVPNELGEADWDITEVGYKYHMNDLNASLGLAHLSAFDEQQARRQRLATLYRDTLSNVAGLRLLAAPGDRTSSHWLFTILVERRLAFIRAMKARGVEAAVWHRRIDRHTLFGGVRSDLPNQTRFDEHQVAIPLRSSMTDDEAHCVLDAVRAGW